MSQLPAGSGGFINPEAVISQLQIVSGMKVADFGSGHGYFAIPLAKAVGQTGKVYAFDVLEDALSNIESKAEAESLKNVEPLRVNLEKNQGTGIPDNTCDVVLLANVLYQSQKKEEIIQEGLRILKPKGSLVVIDWKPDDLTIGPKEGWRVAKQKVKELVQKQEAAFVKEFEAGNFHYGLIFVK